MSKNKEIGKKGESVAVDYLLSQGYLILQTNYRYEKHEIDIICQKDRTLIFVEVKTRRSLKFGTPEEAVTSKKIDFILECANNYIESTGWQGPIRFDIISIFMERGYHGIEMEHIKDAFM